jgi:hypothetical protein
LRARAGSEACIWRWCCGGGTELSELIVELLSAGKERVARERSNVIPFTSPCNGGFFTLWNAETGKSPPFVNSAGLVSILAARSPAC